MRPRLRLRLWWLVPIVAGAGLGGLVVYNSWLGDDAYITLRTVEAVLRGDGLVWNPGERVQAYTHPLWMGLLVVARVVAGDAYYGTLGLGWICTALAALLLARLCREPSRAFVLLTAAALSKAFVHYSTSGLENPLSHVLLLGLVLTLAPGAPSLRTVRRMGVLGALLMLNRVDLALLAAPAVLVTLWSARRVGLVALARALGPGLALLAAWEGFSLLYYGAPVPNTAYAKLGLGIPRGELLMQGLHYLGQSATWDPITLGVAGTGALAGIWRARQDRVAAAWGIGALAYMVYVVWIGGDFMSSRFFVAPFVIGLAILARVPTSWSRAAPVIALGAAVVLGVVLPQRATWELLDNVDDAWKAHGITDEQGFYYRDTGLFSEGDAPIPRHRQYAAGKALEEGEVVVAATVGFYGYAAADRATIIDPIGLTDPLLARLPAMRNQSWRVGHALRVVPDGYEESVRDGACRMNDAPLCEYFEHLWRITRGPLLSFERLRSIWLLNTGQLSSLVDPLRFRRPTLTRVSLEEARTGAAFDDSGLLVSLAHRWRGGAVTLRVEADSEYELLFRLEDGVVCRRTVREAEPDRLWTEVTLRCDHRFDSLLLQGTSRPRRVRRYRLDALELRGSAAGSTQSAP